MTMSKITVSRDRELICLKEGFQRRLQNTIFRSLRQITAAWPIDDYSAAFQIDRRKMEGMAA